MPGIRGGVGQLQYKRMDTAPLDGTIVMGLCGRKYPDAIFYSSAAWHFWDRPATWPCFPDYWTPLPGDAPSDYAQTDAAAAVLWCPIGTAPVDGTRVLVLVSPNANPVVGYYSSGWKNHVGDGAIVPTYWLPVPTPPAGYS
jgi:hypothetical protein